MDVLSVDLVVISTGGIVILLLNFLGFLPFIQRHLRLPARASDPRKRAVLGNVPALVLLHCENGRRFADGASPPNPICDHNILDGRPEAFPPNFRPNPSRRPS